MKPNLSHALSLLYLMAGLALLPIEVSASGTYPYGTYSYPAEDVLIITASDSTYKNINTSVSDYSAPNANFNNENFRFVGWLSKDIKPELKIHYRFSKNQYNDGRSGIQLLYNQPSGSPKRILLKHLIQDIQSPDGYEIKKVEMTTYFEPYSWQKLSEANVISLFEQTASDIMDYNPSLTMTSEYLGNYYFYLSFESPLPTDLMTILIPTVPSPTFTIQVTEYKITYEELLYATAEARFAPNIYERNCAIYFLVEEDLGTEDITEVFYTMYTADGLTENMFDNLPDPDPDAWCEENQLCEPASWNEVVTKKWINPESLVVDKTTLLKFVARKPGRADSDVGTLYINGDDAVGIDKLKTTTDSDICKIVDFSGRVIPLPLAQLPEGEYILVFSNGMTRKIHWTR